MSTEIVTVYIKRFPFWVQQWNPCGSIICQLLINASNRKRQESENEKTKSLIVYRLDQLEHKQDKYNHLQERVFKLERMSAVTDEEIRVVNHRIADLEHINSEKK